MTTSTALITFTLAAGLLAITPGLDTALVLRTAAVEGRSRAWLAAAGICCGVLLWAIIVAVGVGALLSASPVALRIMQWSGAAYLLYLGAAVLRRPRSTASGLDLSETTPRSLTQNWFVRGLLTNLLNPKVGVFYLTFLPQFVPAGVNAPLFMVLLACIHVTEGVLWFALIIWATNAMGAILRRPAVVRSLDIMVGLVLVMFAVRLIADAVRA